MDEDNIDAYIRKLWDEYISRKQNRYSDVPETYRPDIYHSGAQAYNRSSLYYMLEEYGLMEYSMLPPDLENSFMEEIGRVLLHSKPNRRSIRIASYTIEDVFRTAELHAFLNVRWLYALKTPLHILNGIKVRATIKSRKFGALETSELFTDASDISAPGSSIYNFENYWRLNQRHRLSRTAKAVRISPPPPFKKDGVLYRHRHIVSGAWEIIS